MKQTVLLLLCILGMQLGAYTQQKRVLLEKYTSSFCGICPNAHLIAEDLAEEYPELTLAFHHSSVDGMGNPYSLEWRHSFNVLGTPMGMIDRSGPAANQIAIQPQEWEARILEGLNAPAYVDISVEGAYHRSARQLALDVHCTFTERPPAGELRLNLMITEDSVIHAGYGYDQDNYFNDVEGHPLFGLGHPIYFYPHHHVVREIVDGSWGTPGVFPESPETELAYSHHYDYFVPWEWDQEKVNLVLFVSLYDEENLMERQVLNVIEQPLAALLTTGSESPSPSASGLEVFPNPAARQVHFRLPENTRRIELLSPDGKVVFSGPGHPAIQQADVSGLPSGMYFARILTTGGIEMKKLIIQSH